MAGMLEGKIVLVTDTARGIACSGNKQTETAMIGICLRRHHNLRRHLRRATSQPVNDATQRP